MAVTTIRGRRQITKGERAFTRAVILGAVSGLRAMLAPALYSYKLSMDSPHQDTILARPEATQVLQAAAVGELAADKMPFMPARTNRVALTGHVLMGGLVGYTAYQEEGEPAPAGAVVGAMAALGASILGYYIRKAAVKGAGVPDLAAAIVEDAVAVSAALHALE